MKPIVVDAKDASASIIHAASEITTAIWSQADEVRSEAATRSIRGSEASLNMLREAADVAGMSLDDYRADLLIRRAAAHHAILAVDKAKDRALDALAVDGVNVAAVMAQFSNEVRGING